MDVDAYLQRIGVSERRRPDLAWLAELQERHLLHVPFENLSIRGGEPIVLNETWLFDKIVTQRRGGFCYELNGLFGWLLAQLNYVMSRVAAGVYNSTRAEFGPPFDHMALLVDLDRPYLVDVGFGDSARGPIPLPDGRTQDVSGAYRLVGAEEADHYVLQRTVDTVAQPLYRFDTAPRTLTEYVDMCAYHQTSSASHFTRGAVCTLATADGRVTLSSEGLTLTQGGHKHRSQVISAEERQRMLVETFGMVRERLPAVQW